MLIREEAAQQPRHWLLWRPILFGMGVALYFALHVEPPDYVLWASGAGAGAFALLALAFRGSRGLWIFFLCATFAGAGFCIAGLRTRLVAGPVAPAYLGAVTVTGTVLDVRSADENRVRLLIRPQSIQGLAPEETPRRVRLVMRAGDVFRPGEAISVAAILDPPPGPASPGAYDFEREAYFQGIGAVGLTLGPARRIEAAPLPGMDALEAALNRWRWDMAVALERDMRRFAGPGHAGAGLAVAMATSHEDYLAKADEEALRGSGLAHLLAIAGLHTAAVVTFLFLGTRRLLVLIPGAAARGPIKKLAALVALFGLLGYFILSGGHPPARRAAITAASALIAILSDRRALSLHALSNAALLVLLLEPECVVEPGFQMSFAATGALVALAERRPEGEPAETASVPLPIRLFQKLIREGRGLFVVASVAGLATAPFSIQHFNRATLYGTPANLCADFIVVAGLMPGLVFSLIGEALHAPMDLLAPVLFLCALLGDLVIAIAHVFAEAPGAQAGVASAPDIALCMSFAAIVLAIVWRGVLRWGFVLLSLAVIVWPRPPPPLAWLGPEGSEAAVVVAGAALPMRPEHSDFAVSSFAQRHGLTVRPAEDLFDCDRDSCLGPPEFRPRLGAWFTRRRGREGRLDRLCVADIVIIRSEAEAPAACARALVLRDLDFRTYGSAEIVSDAAGSWRIVWSNVQRGERPWTLPVRVAQRDQE